MSSSIEQHIMGLAGSAMAAASPDDREAVLAYMGLARPGLADFDRVACRVVGYADGRPLRLCDRMRLIDVHFPTTITTGWPYAPHAIDVTRALRRIGRREARA